MKFFKKYSFYAGCLLLVVLYLFNNPGIIKYGWYHIFDPNDKVRILHLDQSKILTYKDIIADQNIPSGANLIYLNSRWDYEILNKQTPLIEEIQRQYGDERINFIYTAQGLESSFRDKVKWYNTMKDLNLNGFHISLSDRFEDYHDLWREKQTDSRVVREYPVLLLMDKSGTKIDTMYIWNKDNPVERDELLKNLDKILNE